jgi:hypothetical protein
MSDLQDLIKRIQVASATPMSYIYYDESNGKIYKISSKNLSDDEYSVFAIPTEDVQQILTGEKRTDEYCMFYDISTKQLRLKEVGYEDSHKTASTMCYQLPIIKNSQEGHSALKEVFDGTDVFVYNKDHDYVKGQCVWHDNNVYKLNSDVRANTDFSTPMHTLFAKDVVLTTMPTQTHTSKKIVMEPEYVGIHVDVWYKELSHLAGQHVWLNGTIFRLKADHEAYKEFDPDNVEAIVSNVLLYADENRSLPKVKGVKEGDIILNNNKVYSIKMEHQTYDKDKASVFFYLTPNIIMYCSNNSYFELDLTDLEENVIDKTDVNLEFIDTTEIKNGQTILSGKRLYQIQVDKAYDIIVQQNTKTKSWSVVLNPYTKKFLLSSGYKPTETLYFSVTSKYDPNILYKSLEFKVSDLLSDVTSYAPFTSDIEYDKDEVSIYTAKYFDTYAHEII